MAVTQEAPVELSDFEVATRLRKAKQEFEASQKAKENLAGRNEFMRGMVRATDQLQATYQGGVGMVNSLIGNEAEAARRFSNYQDEMRQSTENPATVDKFFSADPKSGAMASAGNMATWAAGTAGSLIPSVAESIASGVAGGVAGGMLVPGPDPTDVATVPVGALAGMFGKGVVKKAIAEAAEQYVKQGVKREAAEQMATQAVRNVVAKRAGASTAASQTTAWNEGGGMYMEGREKGYDNPASAMALGQISGASEVAFGVFPASLRMVFKKAGVDEVAKKSGIRAAAGFAWDVAQEAGQEAFQEFLGSVNESINDPKAKLFTKENFIKWAESAAAGALGGSMFGAGGAAVSAYQDRGQPQTPPNPIRDSLSQNTSPQLPPTQSEKAPTYNDATDNATDPTIAQPSLARAEKLKEVISKGYVSEEDGISFGIAGTSRKERLADAKAQIEELEAKYTPLGDAPNESEADAIAAQQLARRQAAKAGVKPPITTEAPTVTPTEQQATTAVQGEVDWKAIATAGTELLPAKAKEKGLSDDELAKTKSEIEGLVEKATQGDVGAQEGLIAIAKELEAEKSVTPLPEISDTASQNEKVPPVEPQPGVTSSDKPASQLPFLTPEWRANREKRIADVKRSSGARVLDENVRKQVDEEIALMETYPPGTELEVNDLPASKLKVLPDGRMQSTEATSTRVIGDNAGAFLRGYKPEQIKVVSTPKVEALLADSAEGNAPSDKSNRKVYQGRGATPQQVYGEEAVKQGRAVPLLGTAQYYAFNQQDASAYGNVTELDEPKVNKTLVLRNDAQWKDLLSNAKTPHLNNMSREFNTEPAEIAGATERMQSYLKSQGYDSVRVELPEGEQNKRLRETFGHEQLVVFSDEIRQKRPMGVPMPTTFEELEALPKYSIYQKKVGSEGKIRYQVRGDGKRGGGDSLHDTIEQAQEEAALVKQRDADRKASEEKQKADEETAAKKQVEYEASFGGFLSDKPMNKGRQLKILGANRSYKGKVVTIKELIEQKVADGAVVNDRGQLESPDGAYLGSDKITKIGIDYAKHLIEAKNRDTVSQNPKPEPKKGGDSNAKVETEGQTKAQTETEAKADADGNGLLGSKGDQAAGETPSPASSVGKGLTEGFKSLPPHSQAAFEKEWNKDGASIKEILFPTNKNYRAEFEARTGVKLPKTAGGTFEAVEKWHNEGRKTVDSEEKSKGKLGLPSLKEGHSRFVHIGRPGIEQSMKDGGLDYSKQGVIQSTARNWNNEVDVEYTSDDPRFANGTAYVFDVPDAEVNLHYSMRNAPGVLPGKYYVGSVPAKEKSKGKKPVSKMSEWEQGVADLLNTVPAFKGASFELSEADQTVKVTRPDGRETTIHFNADEELNRLGEKYGSGGTWRGAYRAKDQGAYAAKGVKHGRKNAGHIFLRSNIDHATTLNHEVVHWLEDEGIITPEEVEKLGGREGVANAYAEWVISKSRSGNTVFARIYEFFEQIFDVNAKFFKELTDRVDASKPDDVDKESIEKMAPGAIKRTERESKDREEGLNAATESRLFNENFIKIVADDVSKIRKQDVYRLLSDVPKERSGNFENWLIKRRPDLAEEVNTVSTEILQERANQSPTPDTGLDEAALEAMIEAEFDKQLATKKPITKSVEAEPKTETKPIEFTEIKKNKIGVSRTVNAFDGNKLLTLELNRNQGSWSIREQDKSNDIVEGIVDFKKAKNVATRILEGTFDPEGDDRFVKNDNTNIAYSNTKLAERVPLEARQNFASTLKTTGFFTDGMILLKVSDKDRDAILAKLPEPGGARALNVARFIEDSKKAIRFKDNEFSVVGYRGGDVTDRTVFLRNSNGGFAIVDKAYHDTILQKYPTAKFWGDAERYKAMTTGVSYSVDDEFVAVVMPLQTKRIAGRLKSMVEGTYVFNDQPEEAPKPKQPIRKPKTETKLEQAADKARKEADDLWEEFKIEGSGKLLANLDPKLAGIAVRIAIAELKAESLSFAAFVERAVSKIPATMLEKAKPYMEMAWKVAYKRNMTSDPGGKFDDYLIKGNENGNQNESGTDADPAMEDGVGQPDGNGATNGDPVDEGRGAQGDSGQKSDRLRQSKGKTGKGDGREGSGGISADGDTDADQSEQGQPDSPDSGAGSDAESVADQRTVNHVIGPDDDIAVASLTESLKRNINALDILKKLESEGLFPDDDQRKALAQYTGWGGLSQALDSLKGERMLKEQEWNRDENWEKKWGPSYRKLKGLLSKEEFQAAQDSTENAHYTSKTIIQSLWKIAERLGFEGGRVLELGAGIGHFAGLVPSRVRGQTQFVMVERDNVSSRIAKMLYPRHEVVAGDMEKFKAVPGSVTIGIGNVPFAGQTVGDSATRYKEDLNLHNYSIARHLDAVAPGGIVVVISTHNTLDSNIKQRKFLASKGELIGAIRLPNDAFAENAKTEVVTDILIFRRPRQGDGVVGVRFDQDSKITVKNKDGKDVVKSINKYFVDNPEMVLGEHSAKGSMYGADEYTVNSTAGSLQSKLDAAIEKLPKDMLGKVDITEKILESETTVPFGRLEIRNGKVVMGFDNKFVPIEGKKFEGFPVHLTGNTGVKRAKDYIELRDLLTNVRNVMLNETSSDDAVNRAQVQLGKSYDRYVAKHGPLNSGKTNIFVRDPDFYRVLSLENERPKYNPETKKIKVTYSKASIFTERVLGPQKEPESAASAADAVSISTAWKGSIDSVYVGKLLGVSPKEAETKLIEEGLAFRNPSTTELELSDLYLSGNVRSKLEQAKISAAEDPQYEKNVEELTKVMPKDVAIKKDTVRLGATWIPEHVINTFATQEFGTEVSVSYNANTDSWSVSSLYGISETAKAKYKTDRVQPELVLSETLNLRSIKVYDRKETGEVDANGKPKTTQVLNEKETQKAKHSASVLRAAFEKWVLESAEISDSLARIYNDKYNNFVRTKYNGDFLVLPGANPEVKLRPYQKDAIWRIINRGTALLAHAVGSGKTYTMIGAAMEMRRLGLARRPLLVVQNATLGQFATSFQKMYPNANVLVASKDDLGKGKRQLFLNKVSTGNWDAVVMAQSTFDNMASDPEVERAFIQDQLDLLEEAIREEGGENAKTPTVKQLVRTKKSLKNRFDSLMGSRAKKQDNVTFEDMGADALFLDEAHAYKKPTFTTKLSNLVGLNVDASARSLATTIKVRSVQSAHNGRNVVLATGTPVTNTLGEAWHMVNYVSPATNAAFSSRTFDQFIGNFAQVEPTLTMNAGGQYVYKDAIVKFRNGRQLVEYINDSWDIVTPDALRAYMTDSGTGFPELKDGKLTAVTVNRTPGVAAFMDYISRVYKRFKDLPAKERRAMSFIPAIAYGASKASTLDIRMVVPGASEEKNSKLQQAADNIKRIYDESSETKGTQLFFSDLKNPFSMNRLTQFMGGESIDAFEENDVDTDTEEDSVADDNESGSFLYQEIKKKLLSKGIPAEQIAFVAEAKTDKQRQALFERVKNGDIRVLIGSTAKMGVGVNVQDKLIALHHFDTPWLPADLEQREGRILRFGNENGTIEIFRYAMKKTLDGAIYMSTARKQKFIWQVLNGNLDGDSFDDPSSASMLSIEEQLAAIQDDPVFFEKIEVQNRLRELELERESFFDAQRRVSSSLSQARNNLDYNVRMTIPLQEDRVKRVEKYNADGALNTFSMEYEGEKFTDEKKAAELIKEKVEEIRKYVIKNFDNLQTISQEGGILSLKNEQKIRFKLGPANAVIGAGPAFVTEDVDGKSVTKSTARIESVVYLDEPLGRTYEIYSGAATVPSTLIKRLETLLEDAKRELSRSLASVAKYREQIKELESLAGKEWEDQAEYDAKKSRLSEIETQMLASGGSLSSGPAKGKAEDKTEEERKLDDEIGNIPPDVMYQTDDVNPSIQLQALDIALAAEDAGIKTFDQLIAYSVKTVGERRTREIGEFFRSAAKAVELKGIRPVGDILGVPGVTREQAEAVAKAAFGDQLSDEEVSAGIDVVERIGLLDQIGFAPFGSQVPDQGLFQKSNPKWYYKSRDLIKDKMGPKATSEQVLGMLRKNGVNEEELYWSGIEELLGSQQSVTKEEVLAAIDNGARVEEVITGGSSGDWVVYNGSENEYFDTKQEAIDYAKEIGAPSEDLFFEEKTSRGATKYSQYTTPGGENYKELLITLPGQRFWIDGSPITAEDLSTQEGREAADRVGSYGNSAFESSHWGQPNVLVHLRMNERTDADGKKVLFLEEVQSDWHQEGRKKGYQETENQIATRLRTLDLRPVEVGNRRWQINNKEGDKVVTVAADDSVNAIDKYARLIFLQSRDQSGRVPDAPFKKSWSALAMKRAIQYAAENGFDRIAWATGEQQAERYDLSKQVDSIQWSEKHQRLVASKMGKAVIDEKGVTSDKLEDFIGKEAAKKLLEQPDVPFQWASGSGKALDGDNLKVGGEGMKAFYDKMLPNEVNKLVKKFGAKVGFTRITVPGQDRVVSDNEFVLDEFKDGLSEVNSFDITTAMHESAMTKGQTLFQNQTQGGNVKGWTSFISATRAIIGATNKADVSTFIHEIAHPMRRFLLNRKAPQSKRADITDAEILSLENVLGVKDGDWKVEHEEKFAKMWERYWFEGKPPKNASPELESLFKKIAQWMSGIYKAVQQISKPLPQEVRDLFDKLVQRNGFRDTVSQNENRDTVSQTELLETTSIKNEKTNARRFRDGIPALADVATETQDEWLDAADEMLRDDPMVGDRLVKEINTKARNLSNVEVAVMQIHYRGMNNRLEKVSDRLFAAKDANDAAESAKALIDVDIVMNALAEIEEATKAAGREWGRAGVARQIELNKDFSRAAIMRKARIANGGNALSEKQLEDMNALARRVADLEGKLAKAVQEKLDLERRKNVEAQIEDSKGNVQPVPESIRKKVLDRVNAFKTKFASKFASSGKTDSLFATEDEDMADEAKSVIQEYVNTMGVSSLGELLANLRKDLGSDIPVSVQSAFTTAWKDMKDNGDIPVPMVDKSDVRGLSRLAKQIERSLVESGITKLEDVVRGVHESLQEIIPDITEREAMDALSRYGQYSPPSEDKDDQIIADINGRLLEMAKLADMEAGIAPARTGVGRQEKSPEHRELIRKVNQAKRDPKYRVTNPDSQLKSAVSSARTALVNRIYDLNRALRVTKQPIVSGDRKDLAGSNAEIVALRKERDELTAKYKATFPKPGATMEQRIAATAKALDRVADSLEKQMESRNFETKKKAEPISTEELDAKRARIDALRAQREDIAEFKEWNEERKSKAYKANLLKQIADYKDRSLHSYFGPKPKKEVRTLSKDEVELGLELQNAKDEFFRLAGLYRLQNMSPRERAWDYVKETAHLSRALMTSLDFSAVFRQGGAVVFSHPKMAAETSKDMYKAMWSAASEFETAEKMRRDDMYQFAMTADLSLTAEDGKITRQEEAFLGRWARRIGLIAGSARGYTTFMNGIRFALFKHMVANLGKGGQVTLDEAKVIAFYINAATGRSDLGPMMKWAEQANMLFFAPRFVASRFQYLGMPLWLLGSRKVSGRVKKAIAMEYIRHSAGIGSFLALTVALGALLGGDDEDEKPTVSLDPRSSDFLKIKLGETRIDPMSGLSQVITLMGRIASGQRVGADGTVVDLRGEAVPYGGLGMAGTVGNFVRTKFAPVPGAAFDIATGENVVGQDVTPFSSIVNLFIPLSLREIQDTAQSRGIPQGSLIALLSLHGMGSSTYGPESNYRKGTPEIREKQFKKDIRKMTFDSKDPKYKSLLSEEQMTQVKDRRENRKQGLVFSASAHPIRKEYRDDESYNKAVSERDASLENLKKSGLTLEESRKLLIDHWGSSYGSVYEMRKGVRVYKEALSDRLRQLRKAFQPQN